MTPDDLLAAVRARLDETERLAKRATTGPWSADDPMARDAVRAPLVSIGEFEVWVADCAHERMGPFARYNAEHIAYHDPAAVLRRVAADRRILAEHGPYEMGDGDMYCSACGDVPQVYWPCLTVRALADGLGIDLEETP